MRHGEAVSVRALIAMPGVDDGQIIHTRWDEELATLVAAGRFELLTPPGKGTATTPVSDPAPATGSGTTATTEDEAAPAGDAPVRRRAR